MNLLGHIEIINILAPFANNANAKDAEENTPFDVASIYGQSEVVKFLLLVIELTKFYD